MNACSRTKYLLTVPMLLLPVAEYNGSDQLSRSYVGVGVVCCLKDSQF